MICHQAHRNAAVVETAGYEAMPVPRGRRILIDVKGLRIEVSAEPHDGRFLNSVSTRGDNLADTEIAELHSKRP
jgi:hypothetical protein